MAMDAAASPAWEQIELSERYMMCCMFQEAESLSSSIIKRLVERGKTSEFVEDNCELSEMLESAGMVLVQSSKELGRTVDILKQLKVLFGSVTSIPAQVFLTGVCLQIPDVPFSEVQETLEEFLRKWRYVDGKYYTLESVEAVVPCSEEFTNQISLGVDKYLEIVELYVITFLGRILENLDFAISWVDKAAIPEEKRQYLLRRLHSMNTLKLGSSSQSSSLPVQVDEYPADSTSLIEEKSCNGTAKILERQDQSKGEITKQAIMELTRQRTPFWWFRTVTLKFGSSHLVLSNGRIFLGFLAVLVYYAMRRKQASLWSLLRDKLHLQRRFWSTSGNLHSRTK